MSRGAGAKASSCTARGKAAELWQAPLAACVGGVHLAAERWQTEAQAAGLSPEAFLSLQGARWQQLVADAPIAVRVDSALLPLILADGRVKSQFETGTSNAYLGDYRPLAEEDVFGLAPESEPALRPIYGYLDGSQGAQSVQHFGDAKLLLHPETRKRTTVIAVDSLGSHTRWCETFPDGLPRQFRPEAVPELIGAVTHRSLHRPLPAGVTLREVADAHPHPFADGFAEAHIHGGLPVELIDAVVFDRPAAIAPETMDALQEIGVRCLGPDGQELLVAPEWLDRPPAGPGIVTVAELRAGNRSLPVRYYPSLQTEATCEPDEIRIGPAFYQLERRASRRNVIRHELGHSFDDALIAEQPELFAPTAWADADDIVLNGSASDCGERIADAYAALCSPDWQADLERWPVIAQVGRYALSHGYPLHPDAARALAI